MDSVATPSTLQNFEHIFQHQSDAASILSAVLPELGKQLACDRVFLYLRHPQESRGCSPFCWRRHEEIPLVQDPEWKAEPAELPGEDPMFAAALQARPSIFVEDVEAADATVLNRQFEQENFGHRALIHAHLCDQNQLWGVLQPSVFGHPRKWSEADHEIINYLIPRLTPLVIQYVTETITP
ncbi:GAF domain-containing protein [Leptolyngbya sp. FACHB-16]|nr:GAF domain-containing protein [Leptolyngbya sp. FACHB-16]